MKRCWLIIAALLAAPIVGWILGGLLVLLGLNVALRRFEQAEMDDDWKVDIEAMKADIAAVSGVSPLSRGEVPKIEGKLDVDELWRNVVADYREYRDEGYL